MKIEISCITYHVLYIVSFVITSSIHTESKWHNNDVIMSAMPSRIPDVSSVCSTLASGTDQRKHQSSGTGLCAFHRWPVNSPHKSPATSKMLTFDDVIVEMVQTHGILMHIRINYNVWFLSLYFSTHVKKNASIVVQHHNFYTFQKIISYLYLCFYT